MDITRENFPAAFTAMDEAAKAFWAYPDREWQDNFLCQWAQDHDHILARALAEWEENFQMEVINDYYEFNQPNL